MPDIQKKIKAVRRLRGLTQAMVAEHAHLHVKTYQRIEAGASQVTHSILENLAAIFNCTTDDIRDFDLEANQFDTEAHISPEEERLNIENSRLKAENKYLKRLLDKAFEEYPDFLKKWGGQQISGETS